MRMTPRPGALAHRLTRCNGPHTVVKQLNDAAKAARRNNNDGWAATKTRFKRSRCVMCVGTVTTNGRRKMVQFRNVSAVVTTRCSACDVYLCTRAQRHETASCWDKWHRQKRLTRPNHGRPVQRPRGTFRGRGGAGSGAAAAD